MKPCYLFDLVGARQAAKVREASQRQDQSFDDLGSMSKAALHPHVEQLFRETSGAFARWHAQAEAKWVSPTLLFTPSQQALQARPRAVAATKYARAAGADHSYLAAHGPGAPIYRISRTFGAGGFTKVRVAIHSETQEAFALMVMHPHGNAETSKKRVHPTSFASMSRVEGLLASIDSPLRVLDEWVDDKGKVYWRVKLMATDLRPLLFDRGLHLPLNTRYDDGVAARLFLFRDMAHALLPVHDANLVHFDVKPENFLIDLSGAPRVVAADLGMAALDGVVAPGRRRGTPRYTAPEVCFAGYKENVGRSSDIFSLGIVFAYAFHGDTLECYFGKDPVQHESLSAQDQKFHDLFSMQRARFDAAAVGSSHSRKVLLETYHLLAYVHPVLAELVMSRMLSPQPKQRPSAHDVICAINQIASPELLAHGQRVVAEQIAFGESSGKRRSSALFARLLQAAPAYPSDRAYDHFTEMSGSAPGRGPKQASSSSPDGAARVRSAPARDVARKHPSGEEAFSHRRNSTLPSYWTLRQGVQHTLSTDSQDFWA